MAAQLKATHLIRGLRSNSDFNYELNLAHANKMLAPDIESIFFLADIHHQKISSTLMKEIKLIQSENE